MKLLMLADPASAHTIKWANALHERGVELLLFGLGTYDPESYNKNIRIETAGFSKEIKNKSDGAFSKAVYLRSLSSIKKIIRSFNPDVLHSHYASSFGLLGALTNFHPFIVSVWGSDIYNFPTKSFAHKKITEFVLKRADKILSTSHIMAVHTGKYCRKEIEVTPFGIDVEKFKPGEKANIFEGDNIVIGTIKTLEEKYGIKYLIEAFKIIREKAPQLRIKLLIVGSGSLEDKLKKMVKESGLGNDTVFTGYISPLDVAKYHNTIDIYVALSVEESESFGVAVLEASACEKPVIVSDAGGLPEVVKEGVTGVIVEKRNAEQAADAILKMLNDKNLRQQMGKAGREWVVNSFNWNENVDLMLKIYNQVISINDAQGKL